MSEGSPGVKDIMRVMYAQEGMLFSESCISWMEGYLVSHGLSWKDCYGGNHASPGRTAIR